MEITNLMNKAQVLELFEREAVLFGTNDGVPEPRAVELFGLEAVTFAKRLESKRMAFTGYGIGDHTAWALTLYGIQIAATYCNVRLLQKGADLDDLRK